MSDPAESTVEVTAPLTPHAYGVGARFTLAAYADSYPEIILGALAAADATGLKIRTSDISTYVSGPEDRLVEYVTDVIAHAARTGVHVFATVMFSRGCPGEVTCALPEGVTAIGAQVRAPELTGVRARAHWSLYPLGTDAEAGHMPLIYAAIEDAVASGIYAGSDNYATRLDGDLAHVLHTVVAAWASVGAVVQHVATHVSISINSPSPITD